MLKRAMNPDDPWEKAYKKRRKFEGDMRKIISDLRCDRPGEDGAELSGIALKEALILIKSIIENGPTRKSVSELFNP